MKTISRRWESEHRYYKAILHQDLLHDWVILKEWGGKFNAIRQCRIESATTLENGLKVLERIHKTRLKRGYKPI